MWCSTARLHHGRMMNGYDMTGWGWAFMTLGMLAVVALLVLVVWLALRPQRPAASPRELLDVRLARGELDVDEHARILSALRGRPTTP
jgi:putative membrane protein